MCYFEFDVRTFLVLFLVDLVCLVCGVGVWLAWALVCGVVVG